jgi:hypothetical protein
MTRSEGASLVDIELGQRPETYHDPKEGQTGDTQADFTEAVRPQSFGCQTGAPGDHDPGAFCLPKNQIRPLPNSN